MLPINIPNNLRKQPIMIAAFKPNLPITLLINRRLHKPFRHPKLILKNFLLAIAHRLEGSCYAQYRVEVGGEFGVGEGGDG